MAIILFNPELWECGMYECLCGKIHTHYVCRCYGCAEENELDVKGRIIVANKQ